MLQQQVLTQLETFSHFSWSLAKIFLCKFSQKRVLLDEVSILVDVVHDHMEKSNTSTCILGQLLHEEDVLRHFVLFQSGGFGLLKVLLQLVDLIEKDQSKDWLAQHLLRPLLNGKQILHDIGIAVKSKIFEESSHDLWIGLHGEPVVIFLIIHHSKPIITLMMRQAVQSRKVGKAGFQLYYQQFYHTPTTMDQTMHHYNEYNTQSNLNWPGITSNKFPKPRLIAPRRDIIKTGLDIPNESFHSSRRHFEPQRSGEFVFRPRLKQVGEMDHWHLRPSNKKILELQFSQPHPRRERGHFPQTTTSKEAEFAGIRTFYNSRLRDVEDRMQRKTRADLLSLRKNAFRDQSMALKSSMKF